MIVIPRTFYERDTVNVAQDLLGQILVRRISGKTISGIIVETEAYRYKDDAASHSFAGRTERNKAMFGEVGRAYVYFTYGMHYCVNAVARDADSDAVAVRFIDFPSLLTVKITLSPTCFCSSRYTITS